MKTMVMGQIQWHGGLQGSQQLLQEHDLATTKRVERFTSGVVDGIEKTVGYLLYSVEEFQMSYSVRVMYTMTDLGDKTQRHSMQREKPTTVEGLLVGEGSECIRQSQDNPFKRRDLWCCAHGRSTVENSNRSTWRITDRPRKSESVMQRSTTKRTNRVIRIRRVRGNGKGLECEKFTRTE
eukprot:Gb_06834 [translate_table: standard]